MHAFILKVVLKWRTNTNLLIVLFTNGVLKLDLTVHLHYFDQGPSAIDQRLELKLFQWNWLPEIPTEGDRETFFLSDNCKVNGAHAFPLTLKEWVELK